MPYSMPTHYTLHARGLVKGRDVTVTTVITYLGDTHNLDGGQLSGFRVPTLQHVNNAVRAHVKNIVDTQCEKPSPNRLLHAVLYLFNCRRAMNTMTATCMLST